MHFHSFGSEHNKVLMLLHGNATTWEKCFGKVIPLLVERYHVIAVGFDGMDPEEPDNTYTTFAAEAAKIENYVQENHSGHLYAMYANSLGGGPGLAILFNRKIHVDNYIFEGAANMYMGILNKPLSVLIATIQMKILSGKSKSSVLAERWGGVDFDELKKLVYPDVSYETLKNAAYEGMSFLKRIPNTMIDDCNVAFWYGSKEPTVQSTIKKVKKNVLKLEERVFIGYSHGAILNRPQQMRDYIFDFLDRDGTICAARFEVDCSKDTKS